MRLSKKIKDLKKNNIATAINSRLKEFEETNKKSTEDWFSELCFCILTANSKAMTAINIQKELGKDGFACLSQKEVCNCIKRNKHRFHNNKSKYIVEARVHRKELKDKITSLNEVDAREWLVQNVKGLGYKEASHFLRNVGYKNLAILDRHILDIMHREGMIKSKPKPIPKKLYLEIEQKFNNLAKKLKMSSAELDFYVWYIKTGKVLK